MSETKVIYQELLSQLGSSREVQKYLKSFSASQSSAFAIIKVGGGVLQDSMDELVSAISFLYHLGLCPIILHGAGPQVDAAMVKANIISEKINNLRVTNKDVMRIARPIIYSLNLQLASALEGRGIRSRSIQHGVFNTDFLNRERYGFVGEVTSVNTDSINSAIVSNSVPILTCLGETESGQLLNINADIAMRELVWEIKPQKVIFLTPTGGLLDRNSSIVPAVNLNDDYEILMQAPWVNSGMRLKLQQIHDMLSKLDESCSVSITSANNLARELFTHKGAGTLIRKGEKITLYTNPSDEIINSTINIIESSFSKELKDTWSSNLNNPKIILSSSHRAAAVIVDGYNGIPYLDKLIVTPEGQGEGLGAAIWGVLCDKFNQFYWRSRRGNPINNWYFSQADSSERNKDWIVFMRKISDSDIRKHFINDALFRDSGWL